MKEYPLVTFTCTTSRRLELFKRMIDTFRRSCWDKKIICRYVVVDDRSSDLDINAMGKTLPGIEVYRSERPGQFYSLYKIAQVVETKYIFHTEDDWIFIRPDNFLTRCFNILYSDSRIKQVTLRDWMSPVIVDGDLRYSMHVYDPNLTWRDHGDVIKTSDATYPGLTFNPSLLDVDVLRECMAGVEQIDTNDRRWDRKIALSFWERGYRRANMIDCFIKHTGGKVSIYDNANRN